MTSMTSNKPYLLRAIWSWVTDNNLTPYLLVDATIPSVHVPEEHIRDGAIVLNISAEATVMLNIANEDITFKASFNQVAYDIYVPMQAAKAVYAQENGQGMVFDDAGNSDDTPPPNNTPPTTGPSGKPTLKIVK